MTINLSPLFKLQSHLDHHIRRKKGLEGEDLFSQKILALLVEVSELANEWRGFKFWSEDQEPRTYGLKLGKTPKQNRYINPLLEEYVDCLHFILSIGLERGWTDLYITEHEIEKMYVYENTLKQFETLFRFIAVFQGKKDKYWYDVMFCCFIGLGKQLGLTWSQINNAYLEKNKENHARQERGY